MKYLVEADAIALLKNLVTALTPFAQAQQVSLYFQAKPEELRLRYHPEEISIALTSLLCRIITFTPQGESVSLSSSLINTTHSFYLRLEIQNAGVDLSRIGEITKSCKFPLRISANEKGGTSYELHWQMERHPDSLVDQQNPNVKIPPQISDWNIQIRGMVAWAAYKERTTMVDGTEIDAYNLKILEKQDDLWKIAATSSVWDFNKSSKPWNPKAGANKN